MLHTWTILFETDRLTSLTLDWSMKKKRIGYKKKQIKKTKRNNNPFSGIKPTYIHKVSKNGFIRMKMDQNRFGGNWEICYTHRCIKHVVFDAQTPIDGVPFVFPCRQHRQAMTEDNMDNPPIKKVDRSTNPERKIRAPRSPVFVVCRLLPSGHMAPKTRQSSVRGHLHGIPASPWLTLTYHIVTN